MTLLSSPEEVVKVIVIPLLVPEALNLKGFG